MLQMRCFKGKHRKTATTNDKTGELRRMGLISKISKQKKERIISI